MKAIAIVGAVAMVFTFAGNSWAYDGGTKAVIAMTSPPRGIAEYSPIFVVPHDQLTPTKPIVQLLRRMPEPTLSVERIREEKWSPSTGTKAVVLFQRGR